MQTFSTCSVRQLFDAETSTYTYLLVDQATRKAALIDPVLEQVARDRKLIEELGVTLVAVLDTHCHADHITAAGNLRAALGAQTYASPLGAPCVDVRIKEGDAIELGDTKIKVLATPGHTDDSLSFAIDGAVFTGDALLIRGCGRTDFQNGNAADLYRSISEKLFALPAATVVYPGHDYRGFSASTIGEERVHNPRLAGKSLAEFTAIMDNLGLPPPKKLGIAVAANRACGIPMDTVPTTSLPVASPGIHELAPSELPIWRERARLVDVREPDEFTGELGHIPGAELAPLANLGQAQGAWDRAHPVILICRSGRRSLQAAEQLRQAGFASLYNLTGGMLAYNAAGLPIARDTVLA